MFGPFGAGLTASLRLKHRAGGAILRAMQRNADTLVRTVVFANNSADKSVRVT